MSDHRLDLLTRREQRGANIFVAEVVHDLDKHQWVPRVQLRERV
jgi:hypothetical protein